MVGSRVLITEANLRRPKVADLLGLERSVGLPSILAGWVRTEQAIQHRSTGVFDILASGPLPPNPSELLASKHMEVVLHGASRVVRRGPDRLSPAAAGDGRSGGWHQRQTA